MLAAVQYSSLPDPSFIFVGDKASWTTTCRLRACAMQHTEWHGGSHELFVVSLHDLATVQLAVHCGFLQPPPVVLVGLFGKLNNEDVGLLGSFPGLRFLAYLN